MPFAPTVPELAAANAEARHATLDVSHAVLIAYIANGDTHAALARRYGVSRQAVGNRLIRFAHACGVTTTASLVAAAVRDGRIVWDGAKWVTP